MAPALIQFNLRSAHVRKVMQRDDTTMSCDDSVKNKHIFRLR